MLAPPPDRSHTPIASLAPATVPVVSARTRYLLLFAIWMSSAIAIVDRMAWANVSTAYAQSNALQLTALASFFSAFHIGYFITNAISGFGADWFGGKRLLTLSLLALGALTFSFGYSSSIAVGLLIQAAMGLVSGMDYSACVKLLSTAFPADKRATAMGLFLTATPVALSIPNLFIPRMLETSAWQNVYWLLGTITVGVGLAAYVLIREPERAVGATMRAKPRFKDLTRNRALVLAALGGFGALSGAWGFAFWSNALLIKAHHFTPVQAGGIIALFGASGIVGKPISGWLADRAPVPKKYLGVFWCLMFSASLALFAFLESPVGFSIACGLAGFSAWASGVVVATLVVESVGQSLAGSASGLSNALWMLGNVIVPVVIGEVFKVTHSFAAAILALAVGPIFGAIALSLVPTKSRAHN